MKDLEKILKALANKRRLTILKYLKEKEKANVSSIAKEIKLSFKATSRHLNILFAAEILDKEQQRLEVYYCLASRQKAASRHIISLL